MSQVDTIPEDQLVNLLSLVVKGDITAEHLAEELGTSPPTIRRWITKFLPDLRQALRASRHQAVIKDYQDPDIPIHAICKTHDISQGTLYTILKGYEIPLRRNSKHREQVKDEVVRMYQNSETILSIELTTGRSTHFIYKTLRQRGIPLRRP
jgi:transposase-like protein